MASSTWSREEEEEGGRRFFVTCRLNGQLLGPDADDGDRNRPKAETSSPRMDRFRLSFSDKVEKGFAANSPEQPPPQTAQRPRLAGPKEDGFGITLNILESFGVVAENEPVMF